MAKSQQKVSLRERVKEPLAPALVEAYYAPSLAKELHYNFDHEMQIHLAHGLMLARKKIVTGKDMRTILKAVLALRKAGPDALDIDYSQEDLYSYSERHIVAKTGAETGGRLHTGRSRNDLHVTTWRMTLRAQLLDTAAALLDMRAVMLELAVKYVDTVMPGYTHTQHAQPITLGYYFLAFADVLARDFGRVFAALNQSDHCPLGAGALTTTGFPIDRKYTARMLGFAGLVEVAYDAVSSRDDVHEAAAALSILMTNLSRLLQNWNMMEHGFIELSGAYCAVSSIMPQKKNPKALELLKAEVARVTGDLVSTLSSSKNTSYADVYDGVSAINHQVVDAAERTRNMLIVMQGVVKTMEVRPDVMRESAAVGFGTATELADAIVRETGMSFRIAHNIVGALVRVTLEAGKVATDITVADMDRASVEVTGKPLGLSAKAVREALDPAYNIRTRTVIGGPAPRLVRTMAADRRKALTADRASLRRVRNRVEKAEAALTAEAKTFVNGKKKAKAA
jgi:argininosuccinate lyase